MADSPGTYDKEDVKYIIGLVQEAWNAQFTTLQTNQTANFKRLEEKVDIIMNDMVHKKEFEEYKNLADKRFESLEAGDDDVEETINIFSTIRKNWKLILTAFVSGALVLSVLIVFVGYVLFSTFGGTLGKDVHTIAVAHQMK